MRRTLALITLLGVLLAAACSFTTAPTPTIPAPAATPTPAALPTATWSPTTTPTGVPTATPNPSPTPVPPVQLRQYDAGVLLHPVAAMAVGDTVYTIESGKLKALDMRSGAAPRLVTPPNGTVDKHPIQELAALAYSAQAKALYLLDRSGAIYGWDLAARWWLDRRPGGNSGSSQEYPVDLAADGQTVYLLDTNNGRVWRRAGNDWTPLVTSNQLDGAIHMAAVGDLFILVGERSAKPARLLRLRGAALSEVKVNGGMEQPSLIAAGPNGSLLLVDRGFRRLRLVNTASGEAREVLAGSNADILALVSTENGTVLLGSDWLVTVRGPLPDQLAVRPAPPSALVLAPHNLAVLERLPRLHMPVAGAHLPDIDRSLPGSPRPYRFGIHEGIDLYSSTVGVSVARGARILAAADGVVTRADVDYKEATSAQMDQWLAEAEERRMTPAPIQNRLGGQQVWIDHGNGLSTRYLHLSGIAPGIITGSSVKVGDVVGFAGNSGTPEAASGSSADTHLHFEVRIGNGYLGQWIGPIETRRWLTRLLGTE